MRNVAFLPVCWLVLTCFLSDVPYAAAQVPSADQVIRGQYLDSEIVITTTSRLAGAIHSLQWNGAEFIDSFDHGRQLQSACSFDVAIGGRFVAECFNPTEAGCRNDRDGENSTSRLLRMKATANSLDSTIQMAFWLAPGQESDGKPALNQTRLSNHQIRKQVQIGFRQFPNVIDYRTTFTVPANENHRYAQFESLTGYMPKRFSRFEVLDPEDQQLHPVDDGPGEQSLPLVFSTADGQYAMGIWSPQQPAPGYRHAGYGRFRFAAARVVKWNCVFRVRDSHRVPTGEHSFRQFVIVGDRTAVQQTMLELIGEWKSRPEPFGN